MGSGTPEKKRKRASEKHDRPSKKPAIESVMPPLKVKFIENDAGPVPVIASTPGIRLPESLSLQAYTKPRAKRASTTATTNSDVISSELLLHSSSHPKLDFTAREGVDQLDSLWNHYVAIYDPKRNALQLVEARKVTVRSSLREAVPDEEEESDEEVKTAFSKRSALAEAFGTKQSRKAIQSIAENALLSNAPGGAPNAAESALLSSMPKDEISTVPAEKTAQQEIQAAKPLPQPNLSAQHPSDVYSLDSLIPGGLSTLHSMPIRDWQNSLAKSEAILTRSRFVSRRVEAVGKSGDKTQLQLLRFILLLIEFAGSLKPTRGADKASPGSKKLPLREDLRRKLSEATNPKNSTAPQFVTDSLIDSLRRKFVPQGAILARNDITFLLTTICALTLHIPPASGAPHAPNELATDPADLRDDLSLENQTALQYFKELGCRIDKPRESEYAKWGIKKGKTEAAMKRIARLRIPVEFPKVSRGGRR
ncbi:DNA-directed RNA polymerase I subunit RPA49 [Coccidioides immitis RS]|uniref:DNA-directed RNA polymerase I subunit RPA49 n=1 Tax=Coccidioides immitis (strain RS) TaxID=246410 RepID=J3K7B7_COCIM|nr:DNA-directed RNA polymerase I subunit RPA49 [Coccidioides immitis RS]EAS30577.3 DNA-directed RNA polymerase I subunit RPA49 [Coccidioides immitis RS]TPX23513.1 DNA-directed RNA polymerase I subunit rpa49 [Coccidioides immitis]